MKNVSFSCGQNARMIAIVGPVGAGKVRPNIHKMPVIGTCMYKLSIHTVYSRVVLLCMFIRHGFMAGHRPSTERIQYTHAIS